VADIFLERDFMPPLDDAGFNALLEAAAPCVGIHRVEWQLSMMSLDGSKLFCRFVAPDAESVRLALNKAGADTRDAWAGTVHDAPGVPEVEHQQANVLVRRRFSEPVVLDDLQAIEDRGAWCLELRNVKFLRTFFSIDRRRMVCLYRAPDAESVRQAQLQAGMPLEDVWAFRPRGPGSG
jgi:hypothetical protein